MQYSSFKENDWWIIIDYLFISVTILIDGLDLFKSVTFLALYSLLFYYFVQLIDVFASDLTDGPNISSAIYGPTALFNKARQAARVTFAAAKSAARAYAGDTQGAIKEAKGASDEASKKVDK